VFDFRQHDAGPVNLRGYLRNDGRALTETWLTDARTDLQ